MHRRPAFLRVLLLPLALLTLLALPAPANEDDVGFLTRTLQGFLSDAGREVRIRGFEGALSSRARMAELTIADDQGVWLILRDAELDWDRAALFRRRVEVNALTAGSIEVLRPPVSDDSGIDLPSPTARAPFALPELPVAIRIGAVRAERVLLGAPILGEEAELRLEGTARLEGGEGSARLEAERIDGAGGSFRLAGGFDNASGRLQLDLALAEGEDGIAANLLGITGRPALELTAQGDDPITAFRADIRLATDGQQRVAGSVTFLDRSPDLGLLDGAIFRLDIGGDLRPLLAPDLHGFFGADSRLVAEGSRDEDGAISLAELRAVTQALTLDGSADLSPEGAPRRIDLRLDIAGRNGAPVVLPGTGGDGRLAQAALRVGFDAEQGPDWSVTGRLTRLELDGLGIETVALDARGRLGGGTGVGNPNDPDFDGIVEFAAGGIAFDDPALQSALGSDLDGLVALRAPGGGAPLEFSGFSVETATAILVGAGTLDGLAFEGQLEVEAPDLTPFSGLAGRPLGGAAAVALEGRLHPLTGALDIGAGLTTTDLTLDIPEADNLLAGQAGITLSLLRDVRGTELRGLDVRAGTLALTAQGRIVPEGETALSARLRLTDLARLGQGYAGGLDLDFDLTEENGRRHAVLSGLIRDLALGDRPGAAQVGGLFRGQTRITGDLVQDGEVLQLDGLSLRGERLDVTATGVLAPDAQTLALELRRLVLDPLLPGVSGQVAGQADLTGGPGARRVLLNIASDGAIRTGQAPVDALLAGGLALRAQARETGGDVILDSARLTARGLEVQASGRQDADGALALTLEGTLAAIGRLVPGLEGAARLNARLARPAGAQDIDAALTFTGPSDLTLTANGSIGPDLRLALALQGGVEAGLANPFIAPATVQGPITVSGRADGPPGLDALRLSARLSDGRFILPGVGVAFTGIGAQAEIAGARVAVQVSGASTRGGTVAAQGNVDLGARTAVDLTATASSLRIAQPRLFEGSVSGTVTLRGPLATGPTVSGTIGIDEVEIRIPNSPLGRSGFVPDGMRHVGESPASRATRDRAGLLEADPRTGTGNGGRGAPLNLDLTLEAPGRVFVRGRGLDAELGGRLYLGGTTRDVLPAGAFTLIRGRLDLLGNRFTLTEGSASLMGSFVPLIRLVASTESGGVVTSIVLEGPADAPGIGFESVPALPEDEVLARLIFGRSLATLSPFQAAQLALSVATLTGRSESSFLDRTRQALGLDDLDITTDDAGNTAVRAGRYLGENVYADVGVNSAGQSEVRLQLDLTPSVTLRGRTDSTGRSSLGVFFERDY